MHQSAVSTEELTPAAGLEPTPPLPSLPSALWRTLTLAFPVWCQMMLSMMVGWSDTILTGQILGEEKYLAAATAGPYLLWLLEGLAAVFWLAIQAIVARLVGAGQKEEASQIVAQALQFGVVLGLVLAVGMYTMANQVVLALQLAPASQEPAVQYLRIIAFAAPFLVVELITVSTLRAAGHTGLSMLVGVGLNAINILVSWGLAVGWGPLPQWGWLGIATGTMVSYIAGAGFGVFFLTLPQLPTRVTIRWCRPRRATLWRLLRIGLPGTLNQILVITCHLIFLSFIARLGIVALAAHGVAIRCEELGWRGAEAFGIASATLVGQSLGARNVPAAWRFAWINAALSVLSMSVLGVLFYTCAPYFFALFVRQEQQEVIRAGVPVLQLVAFAEPGLGLLIVLLRTLDGAGATRLTFLANTFGLIAVRLVLAYWLTTKYGLYGAWIAMVCDLWVRAIISTILFLRGQWTRTEV